MAGFRPTWLSLGTAALGMDYGVVAPSRRPPDEAAETLLGRAWALGVRTIDTARGYGDAEARIGAWRQRSGCTPVIVTKIPALPDDAGGDFIARSLRASLAALRVDRVELCLLHRASDLHRQGVAAKLREIVRNGAIGGFGVSVYEATEIEAAFGIEGLTAVQAPVSVLDRRLIEAGILERARARGVLVFARSAFLQGALFIAPEFLPSFLRPLAPTLARLTALADRGGVSLAALSLASLRASGVVDSVVIGAVSADEIEADVRLAATPIEPALIEEACAAVRIDDSSCLDPRRWPAPAAVS